MKESPHQLVIRFSRSLLMSHSAISGGSVEEKNLKHARQWLPKTKGLYKRTSIHTYTHTFSYTQTDIYKERMCSECAHLIHSSDHRNVYFQSNLSHIGSGNKQELTSFNVKQNRSFHRDCFFQILFFISFYNLVSSRLSHKPGGSLGHHRWSVDQLSPSLSVLGGSHCLTEFQVSPFSDVIFPSFLLSPSSPATFYGSL